MASSHCIRAIRAGACIAAAALTPALVSGQQASPASSTSSTFTIFVRSMPIGSEQIGVARSDSGWVINSTGRIGAPLDIQTRKLQVRYTSDWKPIELTVETFTRGLQTTLHTEVSGTSARNTITTNGTPVEKTDPVDPSAVLLPSPFFAPYEALAARLRTAEAGSTIPVYLPPTASLSIAVGESTAERIQTANRVIEARRTRITLMQPGLPLDAELWGDEAGRLLRFSVPAQSLDVLREDIASVAARRVTVARDSDEQVRIPANGFMMAGTVSKPAQSRGRMPAVVLSAGAGTADRDETAFGIPIFGHLADALAEAGFLVLRFDKRGTGQSGGRPDAATVSDYADDLRAAVRYVSGRADVDRRRVAVVGHREGGWTGLVAAAKEDRIAALVLVATPAINGAELNMAQLTRSLERSTRTETEKQATIVLQQQIHDAAITGKGWESVPPAMRRQADTPWFQSFLTFDPAKIIRDVDQPILIVHGALDTQVLPANADRLLELATTTRARRIADLVKIPAVNHLLAVAATGEADEYGTLKEKRVSADVANAIAAWLEKTLPQR